jgi:glutamate racemase
VKIIDSGRAVAKQTEAVLRKNKLKTSSKTEGQVQVYTNADNVYHVKELVKEIHNVGVKQMDF